MKRNRRNIASEAQEAKEAEQQLAINPLAAAERLLAQLQLEHDRALAKIHAALGDEDLDKALSRAGESWRKMYAFGHAMREITGRTLYEQRPFTAKLSDAHQRRWHRLRHCIFAPHRVHPLVEMPGQEILDALRAAIPPKAPPTVELEPEYESQTSRRSKFPSME
jgi:hypothetical protein